MFAGTTRLDSLDSVTNKEHRRLARKASRDLLLEDVTGHSQRVDLLIADESKGPRSFLDKGRKLTVDSNDQSEQTEFKASRLDADILDQLVRARFE
jgi:hypothetical protein